ncbi:hypothetical protein A7R81_32035 [Pseudomonas aeruginosa]|nr:hypothetical protein A7R81_32035 [Pseudomonas aeruginosa]
MLAKPRLRRRYASIDVCRRNSSQDIPSDSAMLAGIAAPCWPWSEQFFAKEECQEMADEDRIGEPAEQVVSLLQPDVVRTGS